MDRYYNFFTCVISEARKLFIVIARKRAVRTLYTNISFCVLQKRESHSGLE